MCANSEGSGETVWMGRLAWAFAGRLCDKYHNLMPGLAQIISIVSETEEKVKMEVHVQSEGGDISDIKDNDDLRTDETTDASTTPVSGGILKRGRRTKSEGSLDESFSGNDSSPQKRKRHEVSFDLVEDTDKGAGSGKKKSRKRKNRSKTVDVAIVSEEYVKEKVSSELEKPVVDKADDHTEVGGKRRKVDKKTDSEKSDVDSGPASEKNDLNSDQNKNESKAGSDSLTGKKRKLDSKTEESAKDGENKQEKKRRKDSNKDSSVSQSESETETGKELEGRTESGAVLNGSEEAGKKKKHRRRRKQHKQKEMPELRVIPK